MAEHIQKGEEPRKVSQGAQGFLNFGNASFNSDTRQLVVGDDLHRLTPKEAGVLQQLLGSAPNVVRTEELLEQQWPNVVVGDNALQQVISRLRRALGDEAHEPRYIETVSKLGYRFLLQPGVHPDDSIAKIRIVVSVLSLEDASSDGGLGWLAEGLSEELRHQISRIDHGTKYRVIPSLLQRGSTEVDPSVNLLVNGTITRLVDSIDVVVNLVERSTGSTLWSEKFIGNSNETLDLQRQLAAAISGFFGHSVSALSSRWGPKAPLAYAPFLKYLHVLHTGETWEKQQELLFRVLDFDPKWEAGWGLASDLWQQAVTHGFEGSLEKAQEAVGRCRAETRDQSTLVARARLLAYWDGDLSEAEVYMRKHGLWFEYCLLMMRSGLYREAISYLDYFVSHLKPYAAGAWNVLALAYCYVRDHDRAILAVEQANRLSPPNSFNTWWPLLWSLPAAGRFQEAEEFLGRLKETHDVLPPDTVAKSLAVGLMGGFEWRLGKERGDIQAASIGVDRYLQSRYHEQSGYMLLLDMEDPRTEDYLIRARKHLGSLRYNWLSVDPFLPDHLRTHPALLALYEDLGFTDAWKKELLNRVATLPADSGLRVV